MNIDPRILNRLQGLLAMTESNNEHEASNAQAKLEALCAKYGVKLEDLASVNEVKDIHWFRYDSAHSKTILRQTALRVLGADADAYYVQRNKQLYLGFECTASGAAELGLWWSVMRAAFKKHEEASAIAFAHANKLYRPEPLKNDTERELTSVELQALQMARNIERTEVHTAIEKKRG